GEAQAVELVRQTFGGLVAGSLTIAGAASGDLVTMRASGTLPSFIPFLPGLPVDMTATMHKEELLGAGGGAQP
ncbi:MAG: hypothetical protein L0Y54_11115, partial [Sporichthyaceae bacterium]|nr:hypothetical protein [Sporichthyaceae bacterium]